MIRRKHNGVSQTLRAAGQRRAEVHKELLDYEGALARASQAMPDECAAASKAWASVIKKLDLEAEAAELQRLGEARKERFLAALRSIPTRDREGGRHG